MTQLHLYISDELAERIQRQAQSANLSVSRYLADLVQREVAADWPSGYFEEVVGGWQGEPLERADQGEFERRDLIENLQ